MKNIKCKYKIEGTDHELEMIFVEGTADDFYLFGAEEKIQVKIKDFFISKMPVTQALWKNIMGENANPSIVKNNNMAVENISWNEITEPDGFLDKINQSKLMTAIKDQLRENKKINFHLPSETEWEYAARGGKNWKDDFIHSGSNNIVEVAWYQENSWDRTHEVGQKAPNQLGIYDMNGNVWEWCQDYFHEDINTIPKDGSPVSEKSDSNVLRGGCFHNWAIHCTVFKRYEIMPDYKDGCIGFRLALSV